MILVIGGAGYIGSHFIKLLRERNEDHLVFDNFEQGHRAALQGSPYFEGDLRDATSLAVCFTEHPDIDVVMHFAAYISVGESERNPAKYWSNNSCGVLNLLEAMNRFKLTRLVFSSTAAIFGEPQYVPLDEAHPKLPTSCYGDTKLAVERMLAKFDSAHGLKSVCLRYFNAAGADPGGQIGEDHDPEEHLVPLAIASALGRRPSLRVFGEDWDTPDGTCIRDYIHVLDLAAAHLLAVEHLRADGGSRQYNLGNGRGYSVKEVIETVSRIGGRKVPTEGAPRRPGDPARLIASSKAIQADWGWEPRFPELETIVQHAWTWHTGHPDGFG
jgi:UDP-glucose 4-epimerase